MGGGVTEIAPGQGHRIGIRIVQFKPVFSRLRLGHPLIERKGGLGAGEQRGGIREVGAGHRQLPRAGAITDPADAQIRSLRPEAQGVQHRCPVEQQQIFPTRPESETSMQSRSGRVAIAPHHQITQGRDGGSWGKDKTVWQQGVIRQTDAGQVDGGSGVILQFDIVRETVPMGQGPAVVCEDFVDHEGTGSGGRRAVGERRFRREDGGVPIGIEVFHPPVIGAAVSELTERDRPCRQIGRTFMESSRSIVGAIRRPDFPT